MGLREKRAELRNIRRNVCSEHPDGILGLWGGMPWCSECKGEPVALVRVLSEREKYLTGDNTQNAAIQSRLRDKYGEMTVTTETALVLRSEFQDHELAAVGKRFTGLVPGFGKDISELDLLMATQLAENGFQPMHFNVLHGRLTLNYDGRVFWTKRALGALDGGQTHRPMTAEERTAYQLADDEIGIVATVFKLNPAAPGGKVAYENFGRAGGPREDNPLAKPAQTKTSQGGKQYVTGGHAPEMALKRAYARTMQLAAPLGVNMETYLPGEVMSESTGEITVVDEDVPPAIAPAEDDNDPAAAIVDEPANPKPVSQALLKLAVDKLSQLGFEKDDLDGFNYADLNGGRAVIEMLRDKYSADEVAIAVKAVIDPDPPTPPEPDPEPVTPATRVEGNEVVQELPW